MWRSLKTRTVERLGGVVPCVILAVLLTSNPTGGTRLSDYIRHFEPLHYDHKDVYEQHHRVKRTVSESISLDIKAFDREFKIRLQRDHGVIFEDIQIEDSNGPLSADVDRAYIGHLEDGGKDEYVHGTLSKEGHFSGKINTRNGTYMIQEAHHFFDNEQPFHSVIYRDSDVDFDMDSISCKSQQLRKYIRGPQNKENEEQADLKFVPDLQEGLHTYSDIPHTRKKRTIDPAKTTCFLYLQADHTFYTKLGSNTDRVIEELTQYVQAINEIYPSIDFDGDSSNDGIRFVIERIKVHTDENAEGYKFKGNYGVEKFLEVLSEDDYDAFCLVYIFTHRDFADGVLGLAWTGDLVYAGGVCEKKANFDGKSKTLNTGLVTTRNFAKDVPALISHITFAHEAGHNMGSPHDPDETTCAPSSVDGKYIMYSRATPGDKVNNKKFSSCSIAKMASIMAKKARGASGCFKPFPGTICGNKVVEDGEECDCGWDDDCSESCCVPKSTSPGAATPCKLKATNRCSPSSGPCCSSSCQLITQAENHVCRAASKCSDVAYCDSDIYNETCPPAALKPNATSCGDGQVCYKGECSSEAVCIASGRESCQCEPSVSNDWSDPKLCHVCCIDPADNKCKSTYSTPGIQNATTVSGTACMNYLGYCDVFNVCRDIDPEGPLSNLRKLLSLKTLENVKTWLKEYWYVAVIGGVVFFVLMFEGSNRGKGYLLSVVHRVSRGRAQEVLTIEVSICDLPVDNTDSDVAGLGVLDSYRWWRKPEYPTGKHWATPKHMPHHWNELVELVPLTGHKLWFGRKM